MGGLLSLRGQIRKRGWGRSGERETPVVGENFILTTIEVENMGKIMWGKTTSLETALNCYDSSFFFLV
ncbi:hypothetical protein HanRHA438_Chr16g0738761 [Helianthus annuus]|nr:hypothetical protein HanRHA438_Chr16g0738761 [Helianthus annuus]